MQHPSIGDRKTWSTYWQALDQPWRTEPEIDTERQAYLNKCLTTPLDLEKDIYPFKGIKLNRADVEWLVATQEGRKEQEKLNTEQRQETRGLPLYAADLSGVHLEGIVLAEAHLKGADLSQAHLEGALLTEAHLEGAYLSEAYLEQADLRFAHLEGAYLYSAHMKKTNLYLAHLEGASLRSAHLEGSSFAETHLEGADLRLANLEGTDLHGAHLEGKVISSNDLERICKWKENFPAELSPADLRSASFDTATNLKDVILGDKKHGSVSLANVNWSGVNLTVVDWEAVKILGDELNARQCKSSELKRTKKVKIHEKKELLDRYLAAVRTNRQLVAVLQEQGMKEEASHFSYRAQVLQREVLRQRGARRLGHFLFSLFLDGLAGYGYKPFRSIIAYVLLIIVFAMLYYTFGQVVKPYPLSLLAAFVLSVTSFHGRGFFPGENVSLDNPLR